MPRLSDIIGHRRELDALVRAWKAGELPHAYLFLGEPGLGKRAVAERFARALVCLAPTESLDACGACRACKQGTPLVHPDVIVYEPAGAQSLEREGAAVGATSIDQMRDLREKAHFAPIYGAKKVFLIPMAETLSSAAANCLLKTLEEPPPFAVIILVAPSEKRVFPTLVSRSRRLYFRPLPVGELARGLVERFGASEKEAQNLARTHCGRPGPAIVELGDEGSRAKRRLFCDLVVELARADLPRVFLVVDKIFAASALYASERVEQAKADQDAGIEEVAETKTARRLSERVARMLQADFLADFVGFAATWYRDLLAVSVGSPSDAVINADFETEIREAADAASPCALSSLLATATTAKGLLNHNANSRLVLESLAWRIAKAHAPGS